MGGQPGSWLCPFPVVDTLDTRTDVASRRASVTTSMGCCGQGVGPGVERCVSGGERGRIGGHLGRAPEGMIS